MATYQVYGTAKASPADADWELLAETSDAVVATQLVHESEGTFWRRRVSLRAAACSVRRPEDRRSERVWRGRR